MVNGNPHPMGWGWRSGLNSPWEGPVEDTTPRVILESL
jgi:hypothetical protein